VSRARPPRGQRGLLPVPVIPGTQFPPAAVPRPPAVRRRLFLVSGAVVAAGVALAVTLLLRGSSRPHVVVSTSAPVVQAPVRPKPKPRPTAAQLAHVKAAAIAAKLPVALSSSALLRSGSSMYVVGGAVAGSPTDEIRQVDLMTGRVRVAGRFIEPLAYAATARRGGDLYLAGGWTGEKLATGVLRWSPGQSSSLVTRLPVALRDGSAAFVGGRLYVAGGSPQQVFEIDVDSGSLTVRTTPPGPLRAKASNLDYLIRLSRATSSR